MSFRAIVVDDSNFQRNKLVQILESIADIKVISAVENGEKAIDYALELKPDLITLDNMLPDMMGLDVLRATRVHLANTKIIMISAVGQRSVIEEAKQIGADEYLVKPVDSNILKDTVTRLLT